MTDVHPLEPRLRAGLRAAAATLPPTTRPPTEPDDPDPARRTPPGRAGEPPGRQGRGRRRLAGAAAAAVVVAAAAGVVALGADGADDGADLRVAEPPTADPTTSTVPATRIDVAPGRAVVMGAELVIFGPDGRPGGTLSLAPLADVQAVTADGRGGVVACGSTTTGPEPGPAPGEETVVTIPDEENMPAVPPGFGAGSFEPNAFRFAPGRDPEPLDVNVMCTAGSLAVTSVDGREVLLYISPTTFGIEQVDLATGEVRPTPVGRTIGPVGVGGGGGRLATAGGGRLEVWDLATGRQLPVDVALAPAVADVALSPDGATVAVLSGGIATGTSEVVVADAATGAELLRKPVPVEVEGGELAYDGTSVAVGNFYAGPVRIIDVATGAEQTVDAQGLLP